MTSKEYRGKTCAYCRVPEISVEGDHVVARQFFLVQDRGNLPQVPACRKCNDEKSALEHYVLSVLPLGSRHIDAARYGEEHLRARLEKNRRLKESLVRHGDGTWERHPAGFLVPSTLVKIDIDKVLTLFGMIVRGLVNFHFGAPLGVEWYAEATFIDPAHEREALGPFLATCFQNPLKREQRDLGRGTFVYQGMQSRIAPAFSLWQFNAFGGLQFTGVPGQAGGGFTRISGITRPREDAVAR